MEKIYQSAASVALVFILLSLYAHAESIETLYGVPLTSSVPLGATKPVYPKDNPGTKEKILLGMRLFFDPVLSKRKTFSCASCHQLQYAFSNGAAVATGENGVLGSRNVPVLTNHSHSTKQFWDGRVGSLEEQIFFPITDKNEMGDTEESVLKKIAASPEYKQSFKKIFHDIPRKKNIAQALATFIRSLVSGNAPYDRYQAGELAALSPLARQGEDLFKNKFKCTACHTGNNFTNDSMSPPCYSSLGVGGAKVYGKEFFPQFKVPTLRNLRSSYPYLHNGKLKSIREVLEFYIGTGPLPKGYKNRIEFPNYNFNAKEIEALEAFLDSLNGSIAVVVPEQ